jgi:hypothetical protein
MPYFGAVQSYKELLIYSASWRGEIKMRILIIGFSKLAYMPYMNFYLEQLTETDNEIHLLYWNRDEKEEITLPFNIKLHEFRLYQEDEVAKIRKIKSFMKYRQQVKQLLLHEKFDLVVVMLTIPGVILYDILKKYYLNRYIFDYRDVTFENIGLYRKVIHKLVEHSVATFVSSDAFRVYLPNKENIYTSHNILLDSLENRDMRRCRSREVDPIRIRYWGFIRHENINKTIIDRIANDSRFELHYHGREQETAHNLKQYCKEFGIRNVFFHGTYRPEERYDFAKETDLLHNIYENDSQTINAMGNKFYDGVVFYIPQLCNSGSYMGKQVAEAKVGFECNPYCQPFADDIFRFYTSMSWNAFEENCNSKLNQILVEYKKGVNVINGIMKNEIS